MSLAIGLVAAFEPFVLWVAGHWPFSYSAPGWAYVALWLITLNTIVVASGSNDQREAPEGGTL